MRKLYFQGPNGEFWADPRPEDLEDVVLRRGADYWHAYNGDACIRYEEADFSNVLFLVFNPEHGFVVRLENETRPSEDSLEEGLDYVLCTETGDRTDESKYPALLGASPTLWPARCFVPPAVAWTMVSEFCRSGRRPAVPSGHEWVDSSEIEVDF